GFLHDLDDADDVEPLVGMIEEGLVAGLHRLQVIGRLEIAHAAPIRAPVLDELIPRICRWLRLEQPIAHGRLAVVATKPNPSAPRGTGGGKGTASCRRCGADRLGAAWRRRPR